MAEGLRCCSRDRTDVLWVAVLMPFFCAYRFRMLFEEKSIHRAFPRPYGVFT